MRPGTRTVRGRTLGALAVLLLGASACAPTDVVVADVPPAPDGGRPPPELPCVSLGDCPPGAFCEKPDCATPVGRCRPRPVFCDPLPAAVCGCNGVNYWNACWRRAQGVEAQVEGECTQAAACGGSPPLPCPDGDAFCARLLPSAAACTANPVGTCWVLPPACPGTAGGAWSPCAGGACADSCTAIRSQAPHSRAASCP